MNSEVSDSTIAEPKLLPKRVKIAVILICTSIGIGVIRTSTSIVLSDYHVLFSTVAILSAIFTLLVLGTLTIFIYKGKNWARIILLILFLIGMITYPAVMVAEFEQSVIRFGAGLLQLIIQIFALVLLFTKESKTWFRKPKYDSIENA